MDYMSPGEGLLPQAPADHIQQVAPIAQRDGAEQGEVLENDVVGVQAFAKGQVSMTWVSGLLRNPARAV